MKTSTRTFVGRILIEAGVILLLCFIFNVFVGQLAIVHGESMEPMLSDKDSLLVVNANDYERFDIICFYPTEEKDVVYVKRIIGLPGETVYIDEYGVFYVNGKELDIPYLAEGGEMEQYSVIAPVTLGQDEYFVLGDNIECSYDSRFIGAIPENQIIGKATVRLTPFSKAQSLEE